MHQQPSFIVCLWVPGSKQKLSQWGKARRSLNKWRKAGIALKGGTNEENQIPPAVHIDGHNAGHKAGHKAGKADPGRYEELKARLSAVPARPGVYMYKDHKGQVIYTGKAKNLRSRMRSYFVPAERLLPKVRLMVSRMHDFDYIVTSTEEEALILENSLIKEYQPRYNILMRDDKSYPYLKVTIAEEFPRFAVVRERKDGKSRYFGPYVDAAGLKEAAASLRDVFPLRSCRVFRQNGRPCLNYHIKRCSGPCVGMIQAGEYREIVDSLLRFLDGGCQSIVEQKTAEMAAAAAALDYEKAARLRDQVQGLQTLASRQFIVFEKDYNLDAVALVGGDGESLAFLVRMRSGRVVAQESFWLKRALEESEEDLMAFFLRQYYSSQQAFPAEVLVNTLPCDKKLLESWLRAASGHGLRILAPSRGDRRQIMELARRSACAIWEERKKENLASRESMKALASALEMEALPERIECFDISHLGGTETVASMVVFANGQPDRKSYRRFKIRLEQNDDFASLQEAIRRRVSQGLKGSPGFIPWPDLLIVDGGYGQVNAVASQLDQLGVQIPLISIAKKQEELFRPGQPRSLRLDRRHEGLKLVQRVRDEAHRFAIEYNRLRRRKRTLASGLDSIPGIGPRRKQELLQHFGSVKKMRELTVEELAAAPGMNQLVASRLFQWLHKSGG